jgi:hypothetical protein
MRDRHPWILRASCYVLLATDGQRVTIKAKRGSVRYPGPDQVFADKNVSRHTNQWERQTHRVRFAFVNN